MTGVQTCALPIYFDVEDYVMICIRLERYPTGTIKKLQARSTGPFEVLKTLESNVYAIDIPSNYGIISIFNIANLLSFKGPTVTPHDPFDEPLSSSLANLILGLKPFIFSQKAHKDIIDVILDEQSLFTKDGTVQHFLVRW